ncbi:MAG: rhomboid family intramembrane serine protease [Salinivirgaceae bacterium]
MQSYRAPLFGNLPPVIKNLLIINILVFLADNVLFNIGIDISNIFALHNFKSEYFKPIQLITHMFMHARLNSPNGIMHIFFNMFALVMFGRMLELVWGSKRFLIFYLVSGIGAALIQSLVNNFQLNAIYAELTAFLNTPSPDLFLKFVNNNLNFRTDELNRLIDLYSNNPPQYLNHAIDWAQGIFNLHLNAQMVGASGAVFGLLLAFGMLFPNIELMLIFIPIPIKAKYFVIIYGVAELFMGVSGFKADNVAHFAHLGGMIFGFFLIKYWNSKGIGKYDRF